MLYALLFLMNVTNDDTKSNFATLKQYILEISKTSICISKILKIMFTMCVKHIGV